MCYTLTNNNDYDVIVSLGTHADVMIGYNDGAPISRRIDTVGQTYGLTMKDGNGAQLCVLFGAGLAGVSAVDDFWFGVYYTNYEPNAMVGNYASGDSYMQENGSYDSGMGWCWKNRTIAAGTTVVFSYLIGVGEVNLEPNSSFEVTPDDPDGWNDLSRPHRLTLSGTYESPAGLDGSIDYAVEDSEEWTPLTDVLASGNEFESSLVAMFNPSNPVHVIKFRTRDVVGNTTMLHPIEYIDVSFHQLQGVVDKTYTGDSIYQEGVTCDLDAEKYVLKSYSNNLNVGTATFNMEGVFPYTIGRRIYNFTINPQQLAGSIVLSETSLSYTGDFLTPDWHFSNTNYDKLEQGRDYDLSWSNNKRPGTATLTITGKGNYAGTLSAQFAIVKSMLPSTDQLVSIAGDDILYDGEPHEVSLNGAGLSGLGTATVTYFRDGVAISGAPVEPGSYTVNVAFAEGECYLGGTIENAAAFTIYALDETDWASFKALYNATGGASWSKTVDVSDVKYARQLVDKGLATIVKGRVTALNLSGNNLSGELPATGVSLSALTSLNISGNNLTGNLGAFVAPMTSLQSLNAANNRIATLYPPLPASVSNASLYPQNVDVTLDVDLPNLDIEALMASFPTILLYDPSSRAYSRLPGVTATGGNDWWASFNFNGTRLAISGVSSQNLYYGASGDVLPVTVTNGGSGTQTLGTMSARLSFAQGDADFNGATNVVDLQAIINQIFAMFDGSKPFNWTAANVIVDEKLNVQDVVGEVNLLLANNSGAGMRRRAPQAGDDGTPAGAANLYWRDGVLYLASDKPVAALDVILAGDVKWDIARYGLTVGTRGSHTVAYSLTGGSIPAGVTPVATALEAVAPAVTAAMLSDTAALEIPVSLTDPDITGVNDVMPDGVTVVTPAPGTIALAVPVAIENAEWTVVAVDGRVVAAASGSLSAGLTELATGLDTGVYAVVVKAAGAPVATTKILISNQ